MTAANAQSAGELTVHVKRVIRAPRDRVFDAWIDPKLRCQWWRTSRGDGPTACEIDARVGGRYLLKQIGSGSEAPPGTDDDFEWIMQGEFLEFDRPRRLVFTWNVNHPGEPISNQRVTIEFREVPGGTEIDLTHIGIISEYLRDGTDTGWTTLLGHLAGVLEDSK